MVPLRLASKSAKARCGCCCPWLRVNWRKQGNEMFPQPDNAVRLCNRNINVECRSQRSVDAVRMHREQDYLHIGQQRLRYLAVRNGIGECPTARQCFFAHLVGAFCNFVINLPDLQSKIKVLRVLGVLFEKRGSRYVQMVTPFLPDIASRDFHWISHNPLFSSARYVVVRIE